MTAPGSRKHDATGRSIGKRKPHPKAKLEGPFIAHTAELLASPVWGALKLIDRRVLDRLELEHMAHAGTENGSLKCTYTDFEQFGLRRTSLRGSLERLETLGLIEIIERGRIARGEFRFPAIYRLSYVTGNLAPTNEWKRYATLEEVQHALARLTQRNKKPGAKTQPLPGAESLPLNSIAGRESATPVPGAKTSPLSKSWEGQPACKAAAQPPPAKPKDRGEAGQKPASTNGRPLGRHWPTRSPPPEMRQTEKDEINGWQNQAAIRQVCKKCRGQTNGTGSAP